MERFYGFDLGDAESAVAVLKKNGQQIPDILTIDGKKNLITAYALLNNGELKIGEKACYEGEVKKRKIRFKSRYLTDPSVAADVKSFAAGILGELYGNGDLIKNEDASFYIGCPAGWSRNARERYREIFEATGFPPAKIISESRAALVSACQSRHLQVGYDILAKPVLVIDIGSSTTDFAYVCGGREVDIHTAGEVRLGGGIMDEILLKICLESCPEKNRRKIEDIWAESEAWKNYCEFAARRLKERYFSEEDYWKENPCKDTVLIAYREPVRLPMLMNEEIANRLLDQKVERLENRSFREVFEDSVRAVKAQINGQAPDLIFLTGGVSRLPAIRSWCEELFPESVIIRGAEPEFSVARGLAWCGKIDEELKEFRLDLEKLKSSSVVEDIVKENIDDLFCGAVDALVEPIIRNAAAPVYEQWRRGEIDTLEEADLRMQKEIESYIRSDQARELLLGPITRWLRPVSDRLEVYTVPICIKHNVPYSAMSLKSYLASSDFDIRIEAKSVFALKEITWLIDSIVSVVIGLLCGGSGIALVAGGLPGILIGFAASFLVLALGQSKMEEAMMKVKLPKLMRKAIPKNLFTLRMDSIAEKARDKLYDSLENEKGEEITDRMVEEISHQIELCLTKMAEIVEIPLG